jgi:hypothetical protein
VSVTGSYTARRAVVASHLEEDVLSAWVALEDLLEAREQP